MSVVALNEAVQGPGALVVVGLAAAVGPFGLQGPVEPLGFAVSPGAVRFDVMYLCLICRPLQTAIQSLILQFLARSFMTLRIVTPCVSWHQWAARCRNPAQVWPFSSGRTST